MSWADVSIPDKTIHPDCDAIHLLRQVRTLLAHPELDDRGRIDGFALCQTQSVTAGHFAREIFPADPDRNPSPSRRAKMRSVQRQETVERKRVREKTAIERYLSPCPQPRAPGRAAGEWSGQSQNWCWTTWSVGFPGRPSKSCDSVRHRYQ